MTSSAQGSSAADATGPGAAAEALIKVLQVEQKATAVEPPPLPLKKSSSSWIQCIEIGCSFKPREKIYGKW